MSVHLQDYDDNEISVKNVIPIEILNFYLKVTFGKSEEIDSGFSVGKKHTVFYVIVFLFYY